MERKQSDYREVSTTCLVLIPAVLFVCIIIYRLINP